MITATALSRELGGDSYGWIANNSLKFQGYLGTGRTREIDDRWAKVMRLAWDLREYGYLTSDAIALATELLDNGADGLNVVYAAGSYPGVAADGTDDFVEALALLDIGRALTFVNLQKGRLVRRTHTGES